MQQLQSTINSLVKLGDYLRSKPDDLNEIVAIAKQHNGWFDKKNSWTSIESIANKYLNRNELEKFVAQYPTNPLKHVKNVGLILAGNIPLVGFHDIVCVLLSGHNAVIKLSTKDETITRAILMKLQQLAPQLSERINIVNKIKDIDAVIATGSDNSAKYFEQYFGKYPNIIRKNRTSIGVINGDESHTDFEQLGKDIFQYYGLGCRNVAKLFVPKDYDLNPLLDVLKQYESALNNQKYKNNFDYNLTLFLINKIPFLQGDAILLTKDKTLHSRIGVIHYQEYESKDEINNYIIEHQDQLQVVVGKDFEPFGSSQSPSLSDFADRVDSMNFLISL